MLKIICINIRWYIKLEVNKQNNNRNHQLKQAFNGLVHGIMKGAER